MNAQQKDVPEKPVLFLASAILIILVISFPLCAPLLFGVFPAVFALIQGEKTRTQVLTLFSLGFMVFLIVFTNQFFIQSQVFLLLLASLYFSVLLGLDFHIAFHAVKHPCAFALIFGYVLLSRFILSLSTAVFPFYWTLTLHLLPFMGAVSRFVIPLCWEALCVTFSAMLYFPASRKPAPVLQVVVMVLAAIGLSSIARAGLGPSSFKSGLECSLIQGGYSKQDYDLTDRHPVLGKKIAQKYLGHIGEIANARFVVLPESAFPSWQIEDSQVIQSLRDLARVRNEYILTGIMLEEDGMIYNACALINPDGQLQNIYRKRTTVLFVETSTFARGILADTFSVDGHNIAPVICYESLFIRSYFRDRKPELYIVMSNDIFAEGTVLSRLHQAYGVINARTLGIPLLQVTQNGPSFYVDTQGELINLTMPYEKVIGLPVKIR
jgi:apolipoprotein N-acyltransferase